MDGWMNDIVIEWIELVDACYNNYINKYFNWI